MIGNLLGKIMGSSLLKNYDVDKEAYMHGGLHNLWKVYRGKKKDRNMMDVSVFIFEKKTLEKKKLSNNQKDEIIGILRKDPQNLAKLRHPNLLSLIEQPMEDQKYLIFVTEPVEFNLSSLQFDATKKDLIPGDLEIKCLALELMEALNFLHNNAKIIHMGLAPEHIYINKDGKLKLGGLNFAQQFSTAESLNVPLNYDLKINEYSVVPNLRFAAPEISESNQCSVSSDLFSVGTLIYFMEALNKTRSPFLLNQTDITDKASHGIEVGLLQKKFSSFVVGFDSDFEIVLRQLTSHHPQNRGPTNQVAEKSWFQDPLLKTIKYLETLDSKDHINKVQFLQGITRILEKFDKKALLKKVIPLLLDQMKIIQLSVNVLPNILAIMDRPNFLTTTEFREYIWPNVQKLCKAKELPAQSLFLILKNTELFMKFVGPTEFQQNFLILINKSLECGVAKLQFLALTKVPLIIKQIEYNTVKQSIIPRILMILEKPGQVELKQKTLEILLEIISIIDQQTMKDKILKTFEKVRGLETDPQICMLLLKIYEQMAKVLGVEEIGLKILPGIIPMLISGTFTRTQFKELLSSVRRLLDQIEQHREKDLREMGQDNMQTSSAFDLDMIEKSMGVSKNDQPQSQVTNKDVFDFLSSLETRPTEQKQPHGFGQSNGGAAAGGDDIMNTINSLAQPQSRSSDPFEGMISSSSTSQQQTSQTRTSFGNFSAFGGQQQPQQQQKQTTSGWESEIPNLGGLGGANAFGSSGAFSGNKKKEDDDFFNSLTNSNSKQNIGGGNNFNMSNNQWANFGSSNTTQQQNKSPLQQKSGAMNLNFGGNASKLNDDPFAELIDNQDNKPQGVNLNLGFGSSSQQPVGFSNPGFNNQGQNFGQQQTMNFGSGGGFQQPQFNNNNNNNQMNSIGGAFNSMSLGNSNFGMSGQSNNTNLGAGFGNSGMAFGNSNPSLGSNNTFGAFPAPKFNQPQQNSSNLLGGGDDFFSQFTNPGQQQNKQQNQFGNLF